MTKYVTQAELVEAVKNTVGATTGSTIVYADTETVPKLAGGKSNPYVGAVKRSVGIKFILGFDYENSVNNKLAKEGKEKTFEAQGRTNGLKFVDHRCILVNADETETYFWAKVEKGGECSYFFKGKPIDKALLNIYVAPPSKTQAAAGIEKGNEVVARSYKFSSILALRMNGEEYRVVERMSQDEKERAVEAAFTPVN